MLARKNIAAVIQALGSSTTESTSFDLRPPEPVVVVVVVDDDGAPLELPFRRRDLLLSWRSRRRATFFSRSVRYDVVSGESGITFQAIVAIMTEGKPSSRNSSRHGAMGPPSATFRMSQASDEAKVVARGAATCRQAISQVSLAGIFAKMTAYLEEGEGHIPEMKIAVRKANSCRLKKKDR